MKYFSYVSQKIGFEISCELSPNSMKCQSSFSGKKKKSIINLSSAESAQRVVKVKLMRRVYDFKEKKMKEMQIYCRFCFGLSSDMSMTSVHVTPKTIMF